MGTIDIMPSGDLLGFGLTEGRPSCLAALGIQARGSQGCHGAGKGWSQDTGPVSPAVGRKLENAAELK